MNAKAVSAGLASVLIWGLAAVFVCGASLTIETGELVAEKATDIHVKDETGTPIRWADVNAVYRPGSKVELQKKIGLTDRQGMVSWVPDIAGIVQISASKEPSRLNKEPMTGEITVAVRYASVAASSVGVMLGAGIILFGGIIWSYLKLRQPMPDDPDSARNP